MLSASTALKRLCTLTPLDRRLICMAAATMVPEPMIWCPSGGCALANSSLSTLTRTRGNGAAREGYCGLRRALPRRRHFGRRGDCFILFGGCG